MRITEGVTDFPQYIVTQLGLNRDPLAELEQDISQLEEKAIKTSTPNGAKKKGDGSAKDSALSPREDDYELVKLISNGAYGAVYLVRHRQTRQRFAMKKINKQNLLLRNQVMLDPFLLSFLFSDSISLRFRISFRASISSIITAAAAAAAVQLHWGGGGDWSPSAPSIGRAGNWRPVDRNGTDQIDGVTDFGSFQNPPGGNVGVEAGGSGWKRVEGEEMAAALIMKTIGSRLNPIMNGNELDESVETNN